MAKDNVLTVVVRRGTLVVDKVAHAIGAEVKLLEDEAKRLLGLGVVALPEVKTAAVPAKDGAQIKVEDGPSVTSAES